MAIKQAIQKTILVNNNLQNQLQYRLNLYWNTLLAEDDRIKNRSDRESIVCWLLGENPDRLARKSTENFIHPEADLCQIYSQTMSYRYDILQKRYLGVSPHKAYHNLVDRLGSIPILRNILKTFVSLSRDKHRILSEILQEVIQEMLERDRYIQKEINFISECTLNANLRNSLLLTSLEEYCLRPIQNRPLLYYRIINFTSKQKRGGITQIPKNKRLRLINPQKNADFSTNILDNQSISEYKDNTKSQEQQRLTIKVIREFEQYLEKKVASIAAKWLKLYLQGYQQEAIAKILNLPISKVYRLREKITYHALKIFAVKEKPELIGEWLEISLKEHNFGLTCQQWHKYWQTLTPTQQKLIKYLKQGNTIKAISNNSDLKMTKVNLEWSKIYFAAQRLRNS